MEKNDNTKYSIFYTNLKAEIIINESDIDDVFKSICSTIISNIQKSLRRGSGWVTDSVIDRNINGSSYSKLSKEFDH